MEAAFAQDGSEAIAVYERERHLGRPFDAIIMDLTIPGGMGGKEAMERLRRIDPSVRAIVSSGYSSDQVMAEFKKHGFMGVLGKPYKHSDFAKLLEEILPEGEAAPQHKV